MRCICLKTVFVKIVFGQIKQVYLQIIFFDDFGVTRGYINEAFNTYCTATENCIQLILIDKHN